MWPWMSISDRTVAAAAKQPATPTARSWDTNSCGMDGCVDGRTDGPTEKDRRTDRWMDITGRAVETDGRMEEWEGARVGGWMRG